MNPCPPAKEGKVEVVSIAENENIKLRMQE
jgi:hypothetical protein